MAILLIIENKNSEPGVAFKFLTLKFVIWLKWDVVYNKPITLLQSDIDVLIASLSHVYYDIILYVASQGYNKKRQHRWNSWNVQEDMVY
jgi:hypothetical protein